MCMGTHFPVGGCYGGYGFQFHLPRLPSCLEPHLNLWKLFLGFCSIYLFNHLKFFLAPSPFSLPFSIAVCVQQDLCTHTWSCSLVFGRQRSTVSLECGVWPLLIFERQQGAFRPCNRGVQGVFSPGSVISALGFDQHRLPSPLTRRCAIALPWSCPGYLHILGAHPFPNPRRDKSCFFPRQINLCDILNLFFIAVQVQVILEVQDNLNGKPNVSEATWLNHEQHNLVWRAEVTK